MESGAAYELYCVCTPHRSIPVEYGTGRLAYSYCCVYPLRKPLVGGETAICPAAKDARSDLEILSEDDNDHKGNKRANHGSISGYHLTRVALWCSMGSSYADYDQPEAE
jgi:hypothetical protein